MISIISAPDITSQQTAIIAAESSFDGAISPYPNVSSVLTLAYIVYQCDASCPIGPSRECHRIDSFNAQKNNRERESYLTVMPNCVHTCGAHLKWCKTDP